MQYSRFSIATFSNGHRDARVINHVSVWKRNEIFIILMNTKY